MEGEFTNVTLADLANGGLSELFDVAVQEVMANIHNPNTPADAKRSITITIPLVASEDRHQVAYTAAIAVKLAGVRGVSGVIHTNPHRKIQGKFLAVESNLRQMRIDQADMMQEETGLPQRPKSVDTPPAQ